MLSALCELLTRVASGDTQMAADIPALSAQRAHNKLCELKYNKSSEWYCTRRMKDNLKACWRAIDGKNEQARFCHQLLFIDPDKHLSGLATLREPLSDRLVSTNKSFSELSVGSSE